MDNAYDAEGQPDAGDARFLEELVARYVDRLVSGEMLDFEAIVSTHPEVGDQLVEILRDYVEFGEETSLETQPLGTLGDYTLRRQLGRGGMGVVYEAWENSMDRRVALKVLPAAVAADDKAIVRFSREARLAGKLSHEHIVRVYSTGVREGIPWYSMEFVEGVTLADFIGTVRDSDEDSETPFGVRKSDQEFFLRLGRCFADVADALQHAHSKGVIHRDIKPSNLILDSEGRLRLLDFGLARLEGQESLTASGDLVGTPLYMSPEQARQLKIGIDNRTDIYSLGATLYEMLTLRPPFKGKSHQDTLSQIIERDPTEPTKVDFRVPRDLETIVMKCLRKEPGERYGTAEALAQDLRRFVRGDPIEARPRGGWERLVRRAVSHRRKLIGLAAGVLVVAALGFLGNMLIEERAKNEQLRNSLVSAVDESVTLGDGPATAEGLSGFFGDPEVIEVGVDGTVFGPAVSADELTLYFSRHEGDPRGNVDIYFTTRRSRDVPFAVPARPLTELNSPYEDWVYGNCLSLDGREIYFTSKRSGSEGQDLWVARFKEPGNPDGGFRDIENLGPGVNAPGQQLSPCISQNGLRLYFENGLKQISVASRRDKRRPFENPVPVSSRFLGIAWLPAISADERVLFWAANSLQDHGGNDLWVSTRVSVTDASGQPVPFDNFLNLGAPINTEFHELAPCLTADWPRPGSGLYFCRDNNKILRAAWNPRSQAASER